jgi:hypothetical protein
MFHLSKRERENSFVVYLYREAEDNRERDIQELIILVYLYFLHFFKMLLFFFIKYTTLCKVIPCECNL